MIILQLKKIKPGINEKCFNSLVKYRKLYEINQLIKLNLKYFIDSSFSLEFEKTVKELIDLKVTSITRVVK